MVRHARQSALARAIPSRFQYQGEAQNLLGMGAWARLSAGRKILLKNSLKWIEDCPIERRDR